ncbi:isoamylase early set domain-containing protein [Urechidicola vernalis]|uniref:Isoamylase early set domain-containing protein n=1 Tax=Urechidicola vernalis TaxID=3075600 RepID=A0ABU2Y3K0_9FLAO|nr:isoamylase early set domain-containing protein [Urechidicola sp. P050]MDT0552788.1 isoamylase early set domain-containing protein [Urechidicola sp. P050]
MAISKKYLKSKPVCKVTFELEGIEADSIVAVGDFNDWNSEATPLKKFKNGKFKTTVDFEKDSSSEFRYIVDGAYINEPEADAFVYNAYAGEENCLLTV